ncbi:MAG: tRNA 4-thiouridine(8) synthase ThiI, partial [Desulfobacterales bacterium]|nr:tRNA 4-thiouridine(8) synthase ThiI [Desulfobacterales bacterium]MDX2509514.1 tRNA 4-thiouridine(8) synthase ThiI [Desulfobacterales bacterium]
MNLQPPTVRALGLCSGGLDSILAALVLRRQGIDVEWVTFETPFFSAQKASQAAQITGITLSIKNITTSYLQMLKNPPCGYGQNMNPCMDCHA